MNTSFMRLLRSYIQLKPSSRILLRSLTTWSPVAATFNSRPSTKLNLNFVRENAGLFGVPELQDPLGFHILKGRTIAAAEALVFESCSPSRTRSMVTIFDELSDTLCKLADLAEFIRIGHPNGRFATAAEDACMSINALVERLNTNRELYNVLKKVVDEGDITPSDEVDQHVARLFLSDFEQSGIHLDEAKRSRVVHLNECILHIGSLFMQAAHQPREVPKDKLAENIRQFFPMDGDNVVVTGLLADSSNDLAREAAYKIFLYPDNHQERRLQQLLGARAELAELCGFPSYAHRAQRGSLASNPETVWQFLQALSDPLHTLARHDFNEMRVIKKARNPYTQDVKPWDTPFLTAVAKNERCKVDVQELAPYFSLGACMEGLNMLFDALFNVTFEPQETYVGELWNPDVHKLAVIHEQEGILGYIYCDFIERPGKPNQDCHFTIRGGRQLLDDTYQLPVVVLLLNFPPSTWTTPSLLTPGMVENLFHEMGHAIHSMMARTKYQHITGTRCSTDFAEVPSVLMEYFASDPRVLKSFARHYKTGKPLPYDTIQKVCQLKHVYGASDTQLQVFYAMLDQQYHSKFNPSLSTTDILADVQNRYYGLAHVPDTAWQHRFGHLVGYGAKYYSYLMSRSIASWIWQEKFSNDPFSRSNGEEYRRDVLAHGGGKPARELVSNFLQKEVTSQAMAEVLIMEIKARQQGLLL